MIKHLFKLIWNQKRQNIGLLVEIFFSFMVLFAVFSFIVHNYQRYRQPLGFNYDNVWVISMNWTIEDKEEVIAAQNRLREDLKSYPEIEHFSLSSGNTPFSGSTNTTGIRYEEDEFHAHVFYVDENFHKVLGLELLEGDWINEPFLEGVPVPIVINQRMKEELVGDGPVLGTIVQSGEESKRKVVGVIDHYKYKGEFSPIIPRFFYPRSDQLTYYRVIMKMNSTADAKFEERLLRELTQQYKGWSFEISYLDDLRQSKLMETYVPILIFLIISGFLIFNVALGLFGVLWQNINKRKQEIGVRRAMGATKGNIGGQFILEIMILTTLSILVGLFFAIQFPLLNVMLVKSSVYFSAILMAIIFIFLLVFICAFYPSRQAASLHPATALHEE